jgi:hypothetical protein
MKITILGQTPSQKNSKRIIPNWKTQKVRLISSEKTLDWKEQALNQLDPLKLRIRSDKRLQIDYMFYVNNETQRDLDNMIASVNDILQQGCADFAINPKKGKIERVKKTGIIIGDHWKVLRIGSADAAVDKANPRAELTITEIDS